MDKAALRFFACLFVTLLLSTIALAQQRADHPLQLLQLLGVESNLFDGFQDGSELTSLETENVYKVLYNLKRFDLLDMERWSQNGPTMTDIEGAPGSHRVRAISLQGRVTLVHKIELSEEQGFRFRFPQLYEVTLRSNSYTASILCNHVPNRWKSDLGVPVDFGASALGLFIKIANHHKMLFVADRVAWHPSSEKELRGQSSGYPILGILGMDVGLFDQLKHAARIGTHDREPFYQMLHVIGRVQPTNLTHSAQKSFDIVEFLSHPETKTGDIHELTGTARRAIKILVDDADIRQRFGIDHYYEIELFVNLPTNLQLVDPETKKKILFDDYPFVFCVRELPPALEEGISINQTVTMTGFFFKLWAFQNQKMNEAFGRTEDGKRARAMQKAPLFIGLPPRIVATTFHRSRKWELYAGALFISMLILSWLAVSWYARQDRRFDRKRESKVPDVDLTNFHPQ